MGEADADDQETRATLYAVGHALALVAAAVIAAWTLVNIWTLANPPGHGTVCALVYPAPPGCAPHARFTPAFISAVVVSLAYSAVTFLLLTQGRHRAMVAVWGLGGLLILSVLAGQFVTWGGVRG
ncbi:hypothetical protein APR04_000434 [Promicromonospora umidemergens]|uniref:Vitamin K epoxide reductase family protein n=1 Tax=Promicromonospora umidemergens TaxID=629679 RepID=A0ABP8X9D1_9MICO|nr:hypothetical protein [Promicromonospora umidemergens]MCP2281545.1 hypothetical protein [Promicromonospora umidemergens]